MLTSDRFKRDLPRWRSLLAAENDRIVFDEIVVSIWGLGSEARPSSEWVDSVVANLDYLQILISNLASDTHALLGEAEHSSSHPGRRRLNSMRQDAVFMDFLAPDPVPGYGDARCETNKLLEVFETASQSDAELTKNALWNSSPPEITSESQRSALMLMAGAIFGIILAFLVGMFQIAVGMHRVSNRYQLCDMAT